MKRWAHRIGLAHTRGITTDTIAINRTHALSRAGLLRHDTDRIVLTPAGKLLADSVAEELLLARGRWPRQKQGRSMTAEHHGGGATGPAAAGEDARPTTAATTLHPP